MMEAMQFVSFLTGSEGFAPEHGQLDSKGDFGSAHKRPLSYMMQRAQLSPILTDLQSPLDPATLNPKRPEHVQGVVEGSKAFGTPGAGAAKNYILSLFNV